MDRAKSATVSFAKQTEDIQRKFSTAFKDIFLSFLGPMALLGFAINYIGKMIADNQRKQEEANRAAIDGTNELMSAEDRYWARKGDREKKNKENSEQAVEQRIKVTEEFLNSTDPRALAIRKREEERLMPLIGMVGGAVTPYGLARDSKVQEEVQKIIAEEAAKNPILDKTSANFKGPEGFSNVVGVGANPVIEAMNEQLEIQKQQLAELQKMNSKETGAPVDFTKDSK